MGVCYYLHNYTRRELVTGGKEEDIVEIIILRNWKETDTIIGYADDNSSIMVLGNPQRKDGTFKDLTKYEQEEIIYGTTDIDDIYVLPHIDKWQEYSYMEEYKKMTDSKDLHRKFEEKWDRYFSMKRRADDDPNDRAKFYVK